MRYKKYILIIILMMPMLLFSDTPPPAPVCSLIGTTYSDSVVNPPSGEDMPLLTQKSVPPNVVILFDNSGSMNDLPCDFNGNGRCVNTDSYEGVNETNISTAAAGYNPTTTYPCPDPLDLDITPNADTLTGSQATSWPACFTSDRVYSFSTTNTSAWNLVNLSTCSSNPTTIRRSCRTICGAPTSCTGTCMTACVNSLTNNGYYYTGTSEYYLGNFLNYYPPKYLIARRAIKLTVYNMSKVKFGLFSFETGFYPFGASINNFGAVSPVCDASGCPKCFEGCTGYDNALKNAKAGIIGLVNNTQFVTWTPLSEALFNIGQYFARRPGNTYGPYDNFSATYRKNLGGLSNPATDYYCQKNFVIIVTDGQPTMDRQIPDSIQDYDNDCREEGGNLIEDECTDGFTPRAGCPKCSSGQFCPPSGSQECCTGCGSSPCTDISQKSCPIGSIHPTRVRHVIIMMGRTILMMLQSGWLTQTLSHLLKQIIMGNPLMAFRMCIHIQLDSVYPGRQKHSVYSRELLIKTMAMDCFSQQIMQQNLPMH